MNEQRQRIDTENAAGAEAPPRDALVLEHAIVGERLVRHRVADIHAGTHPTTGAPRLVYVLRSAAAANQPLAHRIVCEADAARWLRHPSVARIDGYGHTPRGRLYVAVERAFGRRLDEALAGGARLAPARLVRVGTALVDAIGEAHAVGLAHGHLTPTSIVLFDDDIAPGAPPIALAGVGFTWLAMERDVADDERPYVSPERLAGGEPDALSDVYGVASVLLHALLGAAPDAVVHGAVEPALRPAARVLAAARATDPRQRPANVRLLWEDVLAALVSGATEVPAVVPVVRDGAPARVTMAREGVLRLADLAAIGIDVELLPPPEPSEAAEPAAVAIVAAPQPGSVDPWAWSPRAQAWGMGGSDAPVSVRPAREAWPPPPEPLRRRTLYVPPPAPPRRAGGRIVWLAVLAIVLLVGWGATHRGRPLWQWSGGEPVPAASADAPDADSP